MTIDRIEQALLVEIELLARLGRSLEDLDRRHVDDLLDRRWCHALGRG